VLLKKNKKKGRLSMIFVLEEGDDRIRKTKEVLVGCGFNVRTLENQEAKKIKRGILISQNGKRRKNEKDQRRRFTSSKVGGLYWIQCVEGAEVDPLWWKDLCCKLEYIIKEEGLFRETSSLARLREETLP